MSTVTPKGEDSRARILSAICEIEESGRLASVRAISSRVGLTSTSTIHAHLRTLIRQKRIVRDTSLEGKPRYLSAELRACPLCKRKTEEAA